MTPEKEPVTTTKSHPKRGRPRGWRKSGRRERKDYRFRPAIWTQIAQGRKLVGSSNETEFVEQAIEHYVAWLLGQSPPGMSEQSLLPLDSAALAPTKDEAVPETAQAQPTIRIDPLKPDGLMRSFQIHYQQDGFEVIAGLDPIDEHTPALGYRFECHCYSLTRPAQPWGVRQKKQSQALQKQATALILQALENEGWKPSDAAHPQAPETVWHYKEVVPVLPSRDGFS